MFTDLLNKRKSIRKYSSAKVDPDILEGLYKIVDMSNTAGNIRSVKSLLLTLDDERKNCYLASGLQDVVSRAPYILVIGNDDSMIGERYAGEWISIFGIQNASIAAQNIILYLTENNLASCWVGAFNRSFLQKRLLINFTPWVMICFGKPMGEENHGA